MIGIIVACHGELAKALIESSKMIMGEQENVVALNLMPGDNPEELGDRMKEALGYCDQGEGAIILTDLFGATPCNQAAYLLSDKVKVVAGVSLAMLLEVLGARSALDLEALTTHAIEQGRKSIIDVGEFLKEAL